MSQRITKLRLARGIRAPGGRTQSTLDYFTSPDYDIQLNGRFFLLQRDGQHACVPYQLAVNCEFELAEDLRELGFEPSVSHAPSGTVPTSESGPMNLPKLPIKNTQRRGPNKPKAAPPKILVATDAG